MGVNLYNNMIQGSPFVTSPGGTTLCVGRLCDPGLKTEILYVARGKNEVSQDSFCDTGVKTRIIFVTMATMSEIR